MVTRPKTASKPSTLPPKNKVKKPDPTPEECKIASTEAPDNPWGLDKSQYYIELGGVSKFLHFRNSLKKAPSAQNIDDDPFFRASTEADSYQLIRNIENVLHLLD